MSPVGCPTASSSPLGAAPCTSAGTVEGREGCDPTVWGLSASSSFTTAASAVLLGAIGFPVAAAKGSSCTGAASPFLGPLPCSPPP